MPQKRTKARPNGTGTAIWNGHSWMARIVNGWRLSKDGTHKVPRYKTKSGFKSRTAALRYCEELNAQKETVQKRTLQQTWDEWEPWYSPRVGKSTAAGYRSAYAHYKNLALMDMREITPADLQSCMDSCPAGKRTRQMMKVTAGLLWAFAKDHRYVDDDITENLYTGKGKSAQRAPITDLEVERIRQAIGTERYADYVYCLCYLGFRPGEFLALRKTDFQVIDEVPVLIGGSKTEAGIDRIVGIPPQILDIVRDRLYVPGTDLLFPMYAFNHRLENRPFICFKPMTDGYFRETVFKPMMARLGNDPKKVPYCARHTYSDKLKQATGTGKTKAELMGHTNYEFTQRAYQSTDMDDILDVLTSMK